MFNENDLVILKTGEIARISEVLGAGAAYIIEIYKKSEEFSITIDQVLKDEIASLFVGAETTLAQVV